MKKILALLPLTFLACATGETTPATTQPSKLQSTPTIMEPRANFFTAKGEVGITLEVAADPQSRMQGLMHRQTLKPQSGMVFVFPYEDDHAFWMRNTLIPLDMIFVDRDQRIVGIVAGAEPLTENLRQVGKKSKFVIEVNGGFSAQNNIQTGDRVSFEGVLQNTVR